MNGHRIGVAAVVVMLALSGGMAASAITSPSTADSTVTHTNEAPTALQELNASVTFDDQTTSNTTVTVQNVTLAEGGYVAIHDSSALDSANASIGAESVVGVSDYLEAGTHENVTITLYEDVPGAEFDDATVNDTETLVAMLHTETSDDAPPTTPGNNTTDDNATDTPTTPDDNATVTPTTTPDNATDDNTTDDNTTTAPTTPDNDTGDNTTETTTTDAPTTPEDNTTDDNTTDGNETGVAGMAAVAQQNATETFDFVVSDGEEDGPYLVDGETVTDTAEVTFEGQAAPSEGTGAPTDDDTEAATGDLVVESLDAPRYVTPGSNVTVTATVANEGTQELERDVAFRLEGGDVDVVLHQSVTVGAGETANVTFDVGTTDVPTGEYIHGVTTENSSEFDQIAVTNDSAVAFADQNATTNVTVEDVFVPEGGYVAVHNSNALDAPVESVVGVSDYLEAGYHENVTVTLYDDVPGAEFQNDSVSDAQTFVAMTHQETSGNATGGNATDGNATNTFDFVTSDGDEDGPYLVDGQPVVDTAIVVPDDAETNATA